MLYITIVQKIYQYGHSQYNHLIIDHSFILVLITNLVEIDMSFHYSGQTMLSSTNPSGPSHISGPMLNSGPLISGPTQVQSGLGSYNQSSQMPVFNQNQSNIVTVNSMMPNRISMQGQITLSVAMSSFGIHMIDLVINAIVIDSQCYLVNFE